MPIRYYGQDPTPGTVDGCEATTGKTKFKMK